MYLSKDDDPDCPETFLRTKVVLYVKRIKFTVHIHRNVEFLRRKICRFSFFVDQEIFSSSLKILRRKTVKIG
jgi:hypothetical protein